MADISKKLGAKVKDLELSGELGNIIVQSKKLRDQLNKKDKDKAAAGLKSGGRAGYKYGKSVKKKSSGKAIRGKGCEIR